MTTGFVWSATAPRGDHKPAVICLACPLLDTADSDLVQAFGHEAPLDYGVRFAAEISEDFTPLTHRGYGN